MGDIADSIINGDFDAITGEWLGEGDGFPRTSDPSAVQGGYIYYKNGKYGIPWNNRGKKSGISQDYNTIRQLVSVNPQAKAHCRNKKGTMTFIQKYLDYIGSDRVIGKSTKWSSLRFIFKDQKTQFKNFIKHFKTN